ncbi:hypothetical protein PFISCL1PPCAC_9554 [Pristionchus fissidentatus]|uniref:Transmembrane protein n=1 Tax=Pristionchus fissidentatus TaxID=1538716 RepID=A0AAV5VHP8_9BILA|nr:hypothetical protein PFISCL1PPCAC_9554 [Pristionchus fissidentatus]
MTSSSRVLIHLLLLFLIVLMVDGSIQESTEQEQSKSEFLTRRARYGDHGEVAIDKQFKNDDTNINRTVVDVSMLSSGFVFVAIAFLIGIIRLSTRQTVTYETIV